MYFNDSMAEKARILARRLERKPSKRIYKEITETTPLFTAGKLAKDLEGQDLKGQILYPKLDDIEEEKGMSRRLEILTSNFQLSRLREESLEKPRRKPTSLLHKMADHICPVVHNPRLPSLQKTLPLHLHLLCPVGRRRQLHRGIPDNDRR
jgi:hypothetical protein